MNADPTLDDLKEQILQEWPESHRKLSKDIKLYWFYREKLSIENGILLKGGRILISESMQP